MTANLWFHGDLEECEAFRGKFNDLINERIPQRLRHLSFREMRGRTDIDLRPILNGIDSELLRMVRGNEELFRNYKNRFCSSKRRARYVARHDL